MEKIMVQTPVSAPSDNTPTPPLAHPAKAKSTTAKSSKSTEKAAKLRKLTDAQIADYARALVTAAEAGTQNPPAKEFIDLLRNESERSQYAHSLFAAYDDTPAVA